MPKLLKEYALFEYTKDSLSSDESDGTITVKGILQRADALNQNGRIYPRDILFREVENYKQLIKERRAFGELNHANEPIVNLQNVSHMITDIWIEDKTVQGTVKVLDTPHGNIIKAIIKAGGQPGISSRAVGSVKKQGEADIVQDDLQIVCWDFVSEPSTHGAFMNLSESRDLSKEELIEFYNDRHNKSVKIEHIIDQILSKTRRPQ